MKYKGFEIKAVYGVCADWKLDKNNTVVSKHPSKSDISHYVIYDNGDVWLTEDSINDCKSTIDRFLIEINLKRNPIAEELINAVYGKAPI